MPFVVIVSRVFGLENKQNGCGLICAYYNRNFCIALIVVVLVVVVVVVVVFVVVYYFFYYEKNRVEAKHVDLLFLNFLYTNEQTVILCLLGRIY